jgi:hypothetical protein
MMCFFKIFGSLKRKEAWHSPLRYYLGFNMEGSALESQSTRLSDYGTILSIHSWRNDENEI